LLQIKNGHFGEIELKTESCITGVCAVVKFVKFDTKNFALVLTVY